MHTTNELEKVQKHAIDLGRADSARRSSELARSLWLPELCDMSVTLRTPQLLVLAGLRMPKEPSLGVRATGLSPALAVMRHIGKPTAQVMEDTLCRKREQVCVCVASRPAV
jgi:hypothetical protein